MPRNLKRYQNSGQLHSITFSCYRRRRLLDSPKAYSAFEQVLESLRRRYGFVVVGYVLMPEHMRLLINEPSKSSLAVWPRLRTGGLRCCDLRYSSKSTHLSIPESEFMKSSVIHNKNGIAFSPQVIKAHHTIIQRKPRPNHVSRIKEYSLDTAPQEPLTSKLFHVEQFEPPASTWREAPGVY
jgi:REP element-mobilizing transposase RayT